MDQGGRTGLLGPWLAGLMERKGSSTHPRPPIPQGKRPRAALTKTKPGHLSRQGSGRAHIGYHESGIPDRDQPWHPTGDAWDSAHTPVANSL